MLFRSSSWVKNGKMSWVFFKNAFLPEASILLWIFQLIFEADLST